MEVERFELELEEEVKMGSLQDFIVVEVWGYRVKIVGQGYDRQCCLNFMEFYELEKKQF